MFFGRSINKKVYWFVSFRENSQSFRFFFLGGEETTQKPKKRIIYTKKKKTIIVLGRSFESLEVLEKTEIVEKHLTWAYVN